MCISFYLLLLSTLSISSALYFCFSSSAIPVLLYQYDIDSLFLTASRVPSGTILHLLIFPCTGGRSDFFHRPRVFLGSPFCLLLVIFEPISVLLVSVMWLALLYIILVGLS